MSTKKLKSGQLKINNIIFDVPPEQIKIIHQDFNSDIAALRNSSTTRIKSGQKTIALIIETYFATGYNASKQAEINAAEWINRQLAPLLIQIRKCPFVLIDNEKIRKDVLGDVALDRNMAAIFKSLNFSTDTRSPELIKATFFLEIFNYTPFSPDFTFKEMDKAGRFYKTKDPGVLFQDFVDSGTKIRKGLGGYINSYLVEEKNDLDIIYKEYKTIEEDLSSDQKEKLRLRGWRQVENKETSKIEEKIYSRYRRFRIKDQKPEEIIESGQLVIEGISGALATKVARIPLLGHSIPTAQTMGAADGSISIRIFANAEEENNEPVESSKKLAELIRILNLMTDNIVNYHRFATKDALYIKHPLINLLAYKKIEKKKVDVYEEGKIVSVNLDSYTSFVLKDITTNTVPDLPFSSRAVIGLSEVHESKAEYTIPDLKIDETALNALSVKALIALVNKYKIIYTPEDTAAISVSNKNDEDFSIAQQVTSKFNDLLVNMRSMAEDRLSEDDKKRMKYNHQNLDSLYEPGQVLTDLVSFLPSDDIQELAEALMSKLALADPKDKRFVEYKKILEDFQNINRIVGTSCYPDLMLPDDTVQPDYYYWNESETENNAVFKQQMIKESSKRHEDITKQYLTDVINNRTDELVEPAPGPILGAQNAVQRGTHRDEAAKTDKGFIQNPLDKMQQDQNIKRSIENFSDITYSMRRSMPTFKLLFKDTNFSSFNDLDYDRVQNQLKNQVWKNFTDFYDINGIIDIRLVKDKDNPVDLLIVRLLNAEQDIVNRAYQDPGMYTDKRRRAKIRKGEVLDEEENVILREGSAIELRLGYDSDPNKLGLEFTGRIASIGGGNIAEIVCQGHGIELIQELKGVGELDTEDASTKPTVDLISDILHESPEVKSFGTTSSKTIFGQSEFLWVGAGGRTVVENIFAPPIFNDWKFFSEKTANYAVFGGTVGALFGPPGILAGALIGAGLATIKGYFFTPDSKDGVKFVVYRQTIWDILQELTLRHPGTICGIVPFDQRSTIFFGYPEQLYFYRGMTYPEAAMANGKSITERAFDIAERSFSSILRDRLGTKYASKLKSRKELKQALEARTGTATILFTQTDLVNPFSGDKVTTLDKLDSMLKDQNYREREAALILRMMKPFINYHLITSEHDIIENNMTVSSEDVYNAIEVVHPKSTDEGNFTGAVGFSDYEKTDPMKADDDIYPEYIKKQTIVYHNAHTEEPSARLPEKYAISTLCRSLNKVYKGKIKIIGRPNMKPYDIVYVYDSYNNIFGPVQIKSLIHTFSYSTGWVTEIVPQMIVMPSQSTLIPYVNTLKKMALLQYLKNIKLFYLNVNDIEKSIEKDKAINSTTSLAGNVLGATFAGSAIAKGIDIATNLTSKTMSTAIRAGIKVTASKLGGAALGVGIPVIGYLISDYVFTGIANWARYREPIVFLPVTRNGKPWYTGMHGLKKNTALDAAIKTVKDMADEAGAYWDFFTEEFKSIF